MTQITPLITKFDSNSVLYDSIGDIINTYISMTHDGGNFIYFLMSNTGETLRYNVITREIKSIPIYNNKPNFVNADVNFITDINNQDLVDYDDKTIISWFKQPVITWPIQSNQVIIEFFNNPVQNLDKNYKITIPDTSKILFFKKFINEITPINGIYVNSNEEVYSIVKYKNTLNGFNGYDAKLFIKDSVLYIRNNSELVIETFNRENRSILLSSTSMIRDFFIDDEFNYYVIHNKNKISKFSKERNLLYTTTIRPILSTVFNEELILQNDEIELFKIDYVREYTKDGLKEYPIILGNVKNGTNLIKSNELFLAKLDESVANTITQDINIVSYVNFLGLTANYYPYGHPLKVNYNLTNYNYLKNSYPDKQELIFKVILENTYDKKKKIKVEIPVSTYMFKSEYHHFTFRLDGINGLISVLCDGKIINTVQIPKGQYIFQDIIRENMAIGKTYFHNNQNLDDILRQENYYINNATIKQFKMYKKALTDTEIEYNVYRGIDMKDLVVSLPCDQRNELDGIERQFKLNITGNKSNKINVIIKNSNISNSDLQEKFKTLIIDKLSKVLPITTTINNIEFR
jgi:hypothetical protein